MRNKRYKLSRKLKNVMQGGMRGAAQSHGSE
jgi:hypothetical protein